MCQGTNETSSTTTTIKPEIASSATSPSSSEDNDFVIVEASQKLKNIEKNATRRFVNNFKTS
jgi:hypothetical protein